MKLIIEIQIMPCARLLYFKNKNIVTVDELVEKAWCPAFFSVKSCSS